MATLLIADHDNASLNEQTAKAMSAATEIGGDVHVLVAGKGCDAAAQEAAKLAGVSKVLVADADHYENHLAEPMADLIVGLAGDYDTILSAATTSGKNILPRSLFCPIVDQLAVAGAHDRQMPVQQILDNSLKHETITTALLAHLAGDQSFMGQGFNRTEFKPRFAG